MSAVASSASTRPGRPLFPVRRFTVDEYHRLLPAGALKEDDRVELIDGFIFPKMPRSPQHDSSIDVAHECLRRHLSPAWRIRIQSALTTSDSEPEPDLAVVRGPASLYVDRHPEPSDAGRVIEVADSSLLRDREMKAALYGRVGIALYWIINLPDRALKVYFHPADRAEGYSQCNIYTPTQTIILALPGEAPVSISVAELLG